MLILRLPVAVVMTNNRTTPSLPPPPPDPSADPRLNPEIQCPSLVEDGDPDDIFGVSPTMAMEHLAQFLESLVYYTGDVPSTPPTGRRYHGSAEDGREAEAQLNKTRMRDLHEEKVSIVRSRSERSLARLREQAAGPEKHQHQQQQRQQQASSRHGSDAEGTLLSESTPDGPGKRPYVVVGMDSQAVNIQHNVITRKFYSKHAPPISVTNYLIRLQTYCPMSTGVYLATSLYVYRLAVEERAIAVTGRNVHRLVLAGLRVAMRALEDHSYSHAKIAAVGGVSRAELARLEVGFCFLTGFELAVREAALREEWRRLREGSAVGELGSSPPAGGYEVTLTRLGRH